MTSKDRSRITRRRLIGVSVGGVVAAGCTAYGLSDRGNLLRSDSARLVSDEPDCIHYFTTVTPEAHFINAQTIEANRLTSPPSPAGPPVYGQPRSLTSRILS